MRSVLNKYIALPSADVKREDGLRRKTFSSQEEFLKSIMASEEKRFGQMSFDEKNWLALEEFVSFLEKRGISVIILEGQYHPAIMSLPQAVKANGVFRDKLLLIVRRHPNIWFIPRKEQFLFSADDYKSRDWKHVEARAARRYNEYMLPLLCHRFSADAVCSNLKK